VQQAMEHLQTQLPSFAVVETVFLPKKEKKRGIILIEKGRFYGMGYAPSNVSITSVDEVKSHITPYPENGYIRGLVYQYASKFPERKIQFV
jgi:DNA polymerase-3 subunit epsilon